MIPKFLHNPYQKITSLISKGELFANQHRMSMFVLGGTVIASLALYSQYLIVRNWVSDNLQQEALNQVEQEGKNIDSWLAVLKARVEVLASENMIFSLDYQEIKPRFQDKLQRFQEFSAFGVAKADGLLYATDGNLVNISDRKYFQKAIQGEVNISDPLISRRNNIPSMVVAAPIWANSRFQQLPSNSFPLGVVTGAVRLERLQEVITQLKYGDNSYGLALNYRGEIIAHPNPNLISNLEKPLANSGNETDKNLANLAKQIIAKKEGIDLVFLDSGWKYVAYVPLKQTQWSIALVIPQENIAAKLYALDGIAIALISLAGTIVLILWRSHIFKQKQLTKLSQKLEQEVSTTTSDLREIVQQLEQEIIHRQQVENTLVESENKFRQLIENAHDIVYSLTLEDATFSYLSPKFTDILGYEVGECIGKDIAEITHPDDMPICLRNIQQLITTGSNSATEFRARHKDGSWRWLITRDSLIKDNSGNIIGIQGIARDISDRKTVEETLKRNQEFLQSIFDGVDYTLFVIDVCGDGELRYSAWNLAATRITGLKLEDVYGKTPEDLFPKEIATNFLEKCHICIATGNSITYESEVTALNSEMWHLTTITPLKDANSHQVYRLVGSIFDITQRKQIEKEQARLLDILETTSDLVGTASPEGKSLYLNKAWRELLGIAKEESLNMEISPSFHPHWALEKIINQLIPEAIENGVSMGETAIIDQSGQEIPVSQVVISHQTTKGELEYISTVIRDISDQKQVQTKLEEQAHFLTKTLQELQETQTQLIESEKMSSLGQLVAGIAHEINNPVSFIFGNLNHAEEYFHDLVELIHLYQQHYPENPTNIQEKIEDIDLDFLITDAEHLFTSMRSGAKRIRDIILSLRTFSRLDEAEIKQVDIHENIDSTLLILQHRFQQTKPAIQLVKSYGKLPLIECYAGQINQVFMSIIANAIDAIQEANKIIISPEGKILESSNQITISTQQEESNQIIICIADSGIGIEPEKITKIFDPFYTTKAIGQGAGLGLAVSYKIITSQHKGKIWCESEPGKGSKFWIQIPKLLK
ncbi:PAS domain S-box protein [Calothrix sp. UHCC 0171]|uniref:PAS domain S-box protein n=1 Tax=Calothrix sp. UHCC 0171 TaxID=3110245 RepID=UPI002B21B70F|nr:PAS domain S-box protein [Calothrix sp. UHCC 0171]MEA5571626.1 PAS domain S-box protein [Calothrix sp. UHCC 0171]